MKLLIKKYFPDSDLRLGVRVHQLPAMSEWDACAYLGQVFSGEDYELRVLEVRKVRGSV